MAIRITGSISKGVAKDIEAAKKKALEMCGLQGEAYAKMACPVDTGRLRNSISHAVDDDTCYIGTNVQYAPYVELGSGVYYPGGRQTPWCYQDAKGNWHMTHGNRAQPYLKPAVADHADTYRHIIESQLRNG